MKKITTMLLILVAFAAMAQPNQDELREKKEKMDAMKVAYLTKEMDLSAEEAQKFWPVYNEMDKLISKLRMESAQKMRKLRDANENYDGIPDKELNQILVERLKHDEEIAQIKIKYHQRFIDAVGVKKTAKMYHAEMRFSRDLMRKMRSDKPSHNSKKRD